MNLKRIVPTILLLSLCVFLSPTEILANTLFPHTNELLIRREERTQEFVSFRNDSRKDIYITPTVYSYDPQTLELKETEGFIFTRVDKEILRVRPEEILEVNYEVVPLEGMSPGTYFNLILLQKEDEDIFVEQETPVGAVDSLTHLVVLHIADSDQDVYGITSEFARVDMEVIKKGIPFVRPTRIRYTYENITDYVLNPMGEIQIYSEHGNYPPTYIKINREQEKLYPGGVLEEEFEVAKQHISDLYSSKVLVGRFYNGIDENLIIQEIVIESSYTIFIVAGGLVVTVIILLKVLIHKNKKKSKKNPE